MTDKLLLRALNGETLETPPIWIMRQAGRYLPEYRELRKTAGGFLSMVYNPDFASEVTLQPIRRFAMDGAILFSDILVIPHALGQELRFEAGEGPVLGPLDHKQLNLDNIHDTLSPIYETVKMTRAKLAEEGFSSTALIGFAGAPWTVMCYMVEGRGSKDFLSVKAAALKDPEGFQACLDIVVEATAQYLIKQIEAGAEAVKIFDSWSGLLDEDMFRRYVTEPTQKIVNKIRDVDNTIPIIGFPRGAGFYAKDFLRQTGVTAIATDPSMPVDWIRSNLQDKACVQGNLDPAYLLAGGEDLRHATAKILDELSGGPFIFNLGHGINKETPKEHVSELVDFIRSYNKKGTKQAYG